MDAEVGVIAKSRGKVGFGSCPLRVRKSASLDMSCVQQTKGARKSVASEGCKGGWRTRCFGEAVEKVWGQGINPVGGARRSLTSGSGCPLIGGVWDHFSASLARERTPLSKSRRTPIRPS